MRNENILWAASPYGYTSIIKGYTVHNKNATNYKTNIYAYKIVELLEKNKDEICDEIAARIIPLIPQQLCSHKIIKKLGRPSIFIDDEGKGSLLWEKSKHKDKAGTSITFRYRFKDEMEFRSFRPEYLPNKTFRQSFMEFFNFSNYKSNK